MTNLINVVSTAPKFWFRQSEAAAMLGVTTATLARWRRVGRGPAFVDNGQRSIRYRASDLAAWVAAHEGSGAHQTIDKEVA